MTDKLPPNLLALFAPRPPLRYLPHCDHEPAKRRTMPVSGVAAFLEAFQKPDSDSVPKESELQKRDRLLLEKKERQEKMIQEGLENCKLMLCDGRKSANAFFEVITKAMIVQHANASVYLQTSLKAIPKFVVTPTKHCSCPG